MTFAQRNKLGARLRYDRKPIVLRDCAGHPAECKCADCKARQTPEERMAMHKAEVGDRTHSEIPSTLSDLDTDNRFVVSLLAVIGGKRVTPRGAGPHNQ